MGMSTVLAVLLALAAAPGRTFESLPVPDSLADIGKGSVRLEEKTRTRREWGALFEGLSSMKEHAEFLKQHPVLIRLEDETKLGGALAGITPEGILINRQEVERMRAQLVKQGVAEDKADKILQLKLLPVIAHEVRHAINCEEIFKRTGRRYFFPTKEDEISALDDGARVLRELQSSDDPDVRLAYSPGLRNRVDNEIYKELEQAAAGGRAGLKQLVDKRYKGTPAVLELSDDYLVKAYGAWAEEGRKKLYMAALTRQQLLMATSATETQQMQAVLAKLGSEGRIAQEVKAAEEAMEFFKDPERGRKMREYYQERLKSVGQPS